MVREKQGNQGNESSQARERAKQALKFSGYLNTQELADLMGVKPPVISKMKFRGYLIPDTEIVNEETQRDVYNEKKVKQAIVIHKLSHAQGHDKWLVRDIMDELKERTWEKTFKSLIDEVLEK